MAVSSTDNLLAADATAATAGLPYTSAAGATVQVVVHEEEIDLANSPTTASTSFLPAGSLLLGVTARVTGDIVGQKAKGLIQLSGLPVADETFEIDTQTFTWKATRTGAGEVTIGADATECATNLVTAVTADLATVVATQVNGPGGSLLPGVYVEAATYGTAGNAITFTEACTNMTVNGAGTLGGTEAGTDVTSYSLSDTTTAARFATGVTGITSGSTGVFGAHLQGSVATDLTGPWQSADDVLSVTGDAAIGGGTIRVTVAALCFGAATS